VIYQATSTSAVQPLTTPTTAVIVEPGVEFRDIAKLDIPGDAFGVVNTSINVGEHFIDYTFEDAGSGFFAAGFKNGYILSFADGALSNLTPKITSNLPLSGSNVTLQGNDLFVNVSGLSFNSSSFEHIDLVPVPVPAGGWLLGSGLIALGSWYRRKIS